MLELNKIYNMDCIEGMKLIEDNSIDSIVTDPPYGLEFMGKEWDKFGAEIVNFTDKETGGLGGYKQHIRFNKGLDSMISFQDFCYSWSKEAYRILKPGGYLLSFGGTRTYHRMASAIEDAGFEIRDMINWTYGSGFPKSLNIGKAIDKMNGRFSEEINKLGNYLKEQRGDRPQKDISKLFLSKTGGLTGCVANWELGFNVPTKEQWLVLKKELNLNNDYDWLIDRIEAEREIIGTKESACFSDEKNRHTIGASKSQEVNITVSSTEQAKQWDGWGTALKPAHEPIVVARKPLAEKTVAENVLKYGTGGINIDECRVATTKEDMGDWDRFKGF